MNIRRRRIFAAVFDYTLLLIIISCFAKIPNKSIGLGNLKISFLFFVELIVIVLYITFKDLFFRNASVGKKIFQLEIVSKDASSIPTVKIILLRNMLDLVPIFFWWDLFMVMKGKEKYVDRWCGTIVALKQHL